MTFDARWRTWVLYAVGIYASLVIFGLGALWLISSQSPAIQPQDSFTKWAGSSGTSQPYSGVVVPSTAPTLGSDQTKITIVEFADFQCPFCQRSSYTIRQVVNQYGADVRLVYRHFPVEALHPLAPTEAQASMCAQEQAKFWQMHDRLFQHQSEIQSRQDVDVQAQSVGLNMRDYNECMRVQRWKDAVNQDLSDAIQLGAQGTPTWLVNGKKIEGDLTFETWQQIIESLLK